MRQAILDNDLGYFQNQAVEQAEVGAEILDINMGVPNIDEPAMMIKAIKSVQSVVDCPLQIDSSDVKAIENGLRYACGKSIVNSVNGDMQVMDSIFPIVKKYGACVVGLTLDKNGVPDSIEKRVEIAQRIVDTALKYGIEKNNIIIDCLTLTVGAQQEQANYTLEAIKIVKQQLGVKTTLGVSNISFGLPERQIINKNFLMMALTCGLDLPIINPNLPPMQETIYSYRLLKGYDLNGQKYIEKYSLENSENLPTDSNLLTLQDCILKSLPKKAVELVEQMLKSQDGLAIIENNVIPALDIIGERYEKGILFLPQLISASEVAKSVCDIIKSRIKTENVVEKAKIVVATVQGDVHDIGKNIVKTVLQNYGYNIIDLGKDVDIDKVVQAVIKEQPKAVGLSALMTTTVQNMSKTISKIREIDKQVLICVGGAVLNENVAREIGADCYSKDPQQLIRFLQKNGL